MEVVEDCRLEADSSGCSIHLHATTPLTIMGDRELLRRAIENVLRNSIRYAPEQSAIEVQLEATPAAASISVRDCGPGVPPEDLAKIFRPFFRVDNSRDSSTGGLGLGLAIAARAIGVHHGNIRAENVSPGMRIFIELPVGAES
jgi:two-component system sensor histidine kinase CpxA